MTGTIVPWPQRVSPAGWMNDELAELYRVEHSLRQAGLAVETESGISDEGDPWFVFCHADGHVIVHAARVGGNYLLHCATLPNPLTGRSFAEIANTFVGMIAKGQNASLSGRVVAHPSALLSLIVAAAVLSVDAILHETAHASGLSQHFFAPQPTPLAPSPAVPKEFANIYFNAVWRNSEGSGQRGPVWQAVEDAAIGLSVLAAAFPFDYSLKELSGAVLPQGGESIPDTAEASQDHPGRGIFADSVGGVGSSLDQADAIADGNVETAAFFTSLASKSFPTTVDAFKLTALAFPEEDAIYATPSGTTALRGPVGALSLSQDKTEPSSFLSLNSVDGAHLDVTLTSGGKAIDLDSLAPGSVTLIVSGDGALTVIHATAIQSIEVASGTKAELTLSFDGSAPVGTVKQTVTLEGATEVSIEPESAPSAAAPPLSLVIDSQGAQPNTLSLVDAPNGPPHLDITVTGAQDLAFSESGTMAISSTLEASSLTGKLTVGIDLSDAGASMTSLSLGGGNFVVTPEDTVAFIDLSGHPQFELGVDLQSVLFSYSNAATGGAPITLGIDLGSLGPTSSPVQIGLIAPAGVNDLTITSSNTTNSVGVIDDSALSMLTLTGNSSLKITSIQGIAANDGQNVLIDAQTLNGNLSLDASGIADALAGGRQVAIVTGSGESSITDTNTTENLKLTIGSGAAFINIGSGSEQVEITGLGGTDEISVGSGNVADKFTNGLTALSPHQAAIDASTDLTAAVAAASFGESNIPHEALLFSYRGNTYVFVDASGNHIFDPSADAIIKVIGATSSTDLSGVFHSA